MAVYIKNYYLSPKNSLAFSGTVLVIPCWCWLCCCMCLFPYGAAAWVWYPPPAAGKTLALYTIPWFDAWRTPCWPLAAACCMGCLSYPARAEENIRGKLHKHYVMSLIVKTWWQSRQLSTTSKYYKPLDGAQLLRAIDAISLCQLMERYRVFSLELSFTIWFDSIYKCGICLFIINMSLMYHLRFNDLYCWIVHVLIFC